MAGEAGTVPLQAAHRKGTPQGLGGGGPCSHRACGLSQGPSQGALTRDARAVSHVSWDGPTAPGGPAVAVRRSWEPAGASSPMPGWPCPGGYGWGGRGSGPSPPGFCELFTGEDARALCGPALAQLPPGEAPDPGPRPGPPSRAHARGAPRPGPACLPPKRGSYPGRLPRKPKAGKPLQAERQADRRGLATYRHPRLEEGPGRVLRRA